MKTILRFTVSLAIFATSCNPAPSYLHFISKDSAYYVQVANACDQVRIAQVLRGKFGKISPDEITLPDILKEIHPAYLILETNQILLVVGAGRGGYGISWETDGGTSWELATYAEGLKKTFYSTRQLEVNSKLQP
jgi:hypothetical protein